MPNKSDSTENRLGPEKMALIIQKFGGASVANVDRIKQAALRTKAEVDAGHQAVVVVSAMAGDGPASDLRANAGEVAVYFSQA